MQLIDKYDVYQHLMTLWYDAIQDDAFIIVSDGWVEGNKVYRIIKTTKDKNGKEKTKEAEGLDGIESKLLKPIFLLNRYFTAETALIKSLETQRDAITAKMEELIEEHSGEDALFAEVEKINKANIAKLLKEKKADKADKEEIAICQSYLDWCDEEVKLNTQIKAAQKTLELLVWNKYKELTEDEIKTIVVEDKWMAKIDSDIHSEMERISQRLTGRIKELAERYATPLPQLSIKVKTLEEKVTQHLSKMGYTIK